MTCSLPSPPPTGPAPSGQFFEELKETTIRVKMQRRGLTHAPASHAKGLECLISASTPNRRSNFPVALPVQSRIPAETNRTCWFSFGERQKPSRWSPTIASDCADRTATRKTIRIPFSWLAAVILMFGSRVSWSCQGASRQRPACCPSNMRGGHNIFSAGHLDRDLKRYQTPVLSQ